MRLRDSTRRRRKTRYPIRSKTNIKEKKEKKSIDVKDIRSTIAVADYDQDILDSWFHAHYAHFPLENLERRLEQQS